MSNYLNHSNLYDRLLENTQQELDYGLSHLDRIIGISKEEMDEIFFVLNKKELYLYNLQYEDTAHSQALIKDADSVIRYKVFKAFKSLSLGKDSSLWERNFQIKYGYNLIEQIEYLYQIHSLLEWDRCNKFNIKVAVADTTHVLLACVCLDDIDNIEDCADDIEYFAYNTRGVFNTIPDNEHKDMVIELISKEVSK